uniref:Uncharacterized protein n=1 Tax=Arundo donax TaxID=35708 RepID=A0A0A8XYU7_ARUDO
MTPLPPPPPPTPPPPPPSMAGLGFWGMEGHD